jgi:hypothetical protein
MMTEAAQLKHFDIIEGLHSNHKISDLGILPI